MAKNLHDETGSGQSGRSVAIAMGLIAAAALMALVPALREEALGGNHSVVAGSGGGSASGVYKQPQVGGMNVGATNTWAAPGPTPATAKASPTVKAG
jgi:hypothetical protein